MPLSTHHFTLLLALLGYGCAGFAQVTYTGTVLDDGGQPASYVLVATDSAAVYTAEDGRFAVVTDAPARTLTFSSVLYADTTLPAAAWVNGATLRLRGAELATAVVVARDDRAPGSYTMNREQLAVLPAIGGEVDVLRALQTLPSISGAAEGTVAPIIRGSDAQASLILLDGAPIYSPSSFFGFQGSINYETVRSVDVYAGYVPPELGGRSGGVVDVTTRVGDRERHRRQVSVGLPNFGAAFEGPIGKRVAYLAAVRGAYVGVPLAFLGSRFYQGDALAKVNYLGDRWSHQASYFRNVSSVGFRETTARATGSQFVDQVTGFGNELFSTRSNYRRGRFGLGVVLAASRYRTTNDFEKLTERDSVLVPLQDTDVDAGITEVSARATGTYQTDRVRYKFGAEAKRHQFRTDARDEQEGEVFASELTSAFSTLTPFAGVEVRLARRLELLAGARATWFSDARGAIGRVLEPRASLSYRPSPGFRTTVAYNRAAQYAHAFGSTTTAGSFETFAAPTRVYPASLAEQVSASVEGTLLDERLDLRATVYHKGMFSLVQPVNAAQAIFSGELSTEDANILRGGGEASGVEVSASYTAESFGLRLGYAYARSFRRFAGLNDGRAFPFRWERPHRLNALFAYEPPRSRWRLTTAFLFEAGYPFTAPDAVSFRATGPDEPTFTVPIFLVESLHNRRARTLQRLDLGATYTKECLNGNVLAWRFSLTNALARRNPSATFVESLGYVDVGAGLLDTQRISVTERTLFRLIPGIQYSFTW